MLITSSLELSSDKCTFKNAFRVSAFITTTALASWCAISSTVWGLWFFLIMALLWSLALRQGLTSPDGFTGYVTEDTQGVGSICGSSMPSDTMQLMASLIAALDSIGTFLLACCTGGTVGSTLMSYSPLSDPNLLNELGYNLIKSSTLLIDIEPGWWNIGHSLLPGRSWGVGAWIIFWESWFHRRWPSDVLVYLLIFHFGRVCWSWNEKIQNS